MGEREFILGVAGTEPIGEGMERKVYQHRDSNKVAKLHDLDDVYGKFLPGRERFGKAEFYVTKILHMLFPKQVPDIHLMSHGAQGSVHEKKDSLGKDHEIIQKKRFTPSGSESPGYSNAQENVMQKLSDDGLIQEFERIGVGYDLGLVNYGQDEEGNVVYVDGFSPWNLNHDMAPDLPFKSPLNFQALEEMIRSRITEVLEQNKALKYLERLRALVEEEKIYHDSLSQSR